MRASDETSPSITNHQSKGIPDAKDRSRFAGSRESGDAVAVQLWLF
jgi:hypothetical protein